MIKTITILFLFTFYLIATPLFVEAHPGNTDADGCHTCYTNCADWGLVYGQYHCHNSNTSPQPKDSIKSTYSEDGINHTSYSSSQMEYLTFGLWAAVVIFFAWYANKGS